MSQNTSKLEIKMLKYVRLSRYGRNCKILPEKPIYVICEFYLAVLLARRVESVQMEHSPDLRDTYPEMPETQVQVRKFHRVESVFDHLKKTTAQYIRFLQAIHNLSLLRSNESLSQMY